MLRFDPYSARIATAGIVVPQSAHLRRLGPTAGCRSDRVTLALAPFNCVSHSAAASIICVYICSESRLFKIGLTYGAYPFELRQSDRGPSPVEILRKNVRSGTRASVATDQHRVERHLHEARAFGMMQSLRHLHLRSDENFENRVINCLVVPLNDEKQDTENLTAIPCPGLASVNFRMIQDPESSIRQLVQARIDMGSPLKKVYLASYRRLDQNCKDWLQEHHVEIRPGLDDHEDEPQAQLRSKVN